MLHNCDISVLRRDYRDNKEASIARIFESGEVSVTIRMYISIFFTVGR